MLSSRIGRRWIFRTDSGWLGGSRHEDALALVVCGALVVAGVAMLLASLWDVQRTYSTRWWPSAAGWVMSVQMDEIETGQTTVWQPRITYSYRVEDRDYISTQLSLSQPVEVRGYANASVYLERYIPNASIKVYYNPERPSESVTEQSVGARTQRTLTFGLGSCLLGLALLLLFDFFRT